MRGVVFTRFFWLMCTQFSNYALSQNQPIYGTLHYNKKPLADVVIRVTELKLQTKSDSAGNFFFDNIPAGTYHLYAHKTGFHTLHKKITVSKIEKTEITFEMKELVIDFSEIIIRKQKDNAFGITRLRAVEGTSIYESKKTEVILPQDMVINASINSTRQIYSKIPGLNIWENDPGGMQLAIGVRGLNPNRTSNFNTRQNGYDISADALGYPESYYTPPVEALERIEIVRGAASLQYGPQFGGLINYVLLSPPADKKVQLHSRVGIGSFGLFNSTNSVGGTYKNMGYLSFYQYKRGNGWRRNSQFEAHTFLQRLKWKLHDKLDLHLDYTHMYYLAKQPGGITDQMFASKNITSVRERNWFRVNWNVFALWFDYNLTPTTKLNSRFFANISDRTAIGAQNSGTGFFEAIHRPDLGGERTMIQDIFDNIGNETRLIHRYYIKKNLSTFLMGTRIYKGNAVSKQGNASAGSSAEFDWINAGNLERSYYHLPSLNASAFIENIFVINPKISITPGIRWENIETYAKGYFNTRTRTAAGDVVAELRTHESRSNSRNFLLFGIGASHKPSENHELYANISQNYRPITFSDIRIGIAGFRIDPDIKDEKGFNSDLGFRGNLKGVFNYDASIFFLNYSGRIGDILTKDPETFQEYNLRTNIGNSNTLGTELFAELDIWRVFNPKDSKISISVFGNMAYYDARYYQSKFIGIEGKFVEYVPPFTLKSGLTFELRELRATIQYTFNDAQYSDATNAKLGSVNAVSGQVPAYQVFDFSVKYKLKAFSIESGVNNITNEFYFTRRAQSYPGPGILPAEPRLFYLTLGFKI